MEAERKAMWGREMEFLLCVSNHIVELIPIWQTFPDGTKLEVHFTSFQFNSILSITKKNLVVFYFLLSFHHHHSPDHDLPPPFRSLRQSPSSSQTRPHAPRKFIFKLNTLFCFFLTKVFIISTAGYLGQFC